MGTPNIDREFGREWENKHYKRDKDYEHEKSYQRLGLAVRRDINEEGTISKETLKSIVKGKT